MRNLDRKREDSRYQIFIIAIILAFYGSLLSLFRSEGFDNDYLSYSLAFANVAAEEEFAFAGSSTEPLFYLLMWVSHVFGIEVGGMLFIACFFALAIKFYSVAKFGYSELFIFIPLYFSSFFLLQELTQIRLAIGTSFFYLFAYYIYKLRVGDKPSNFFLFMAPLFHYSSIALLLIFIRRQKAYLWIILPVIVLIFIVFKIGFSVDTLGMLLPDFLWSDDRIRGYSIELLEQHGEKLSLLNGGNLIYLYYLIAMRLLVHLFLPELKRNNLFVVNELMIFSSLVIFFVLISSPVLATRFSELFRIFTPIIQAVIITKLMRRSLFTAVVGFSFFVSILFLNLLLYGAVINPINHEIFRPLGFIRNI